MPHLQRAYLNQSWELKPHHFEDAHTIPLELDHRTDTEPEHAEAATWRQHEQIKKFFEGGPRGTHLTFIVCGLGGMTGSGAAPALAEIARSHKSVTVALTVHPFKLEGPRREKNTRWCMERLATRAHSIICIHNDKLLAIAPHISFAQALQVTNKMAIMPITEIAMLATRDDLGSLRHVLDCTEVHIGFGGSDLRSGLTAAVDEVMGSFMPGPSKDKKEWDRALITVRAGPEVQDKDIENIVGCITAELHPHGKVLWGAIRDDTIGGDVKVMALVGRGRKSHDGGIDGKGLDYYK
jgi:cell division protein FtsZ